MKRMISQSEIRDLLGAIVVAPKPEIEAASQILATHFAGRRFRQIGREHARCSWCGQPAAIRRQPPRRGVNFYGDHAACRAAAKADAHKRGRARAA